MQVRTFQNVWDAFSDTPQEAAIMTFKSDLMINITEFIKSKHWRKSTAAKQCGVTIPRLQELLDGNINKFSIEALFNIMTSLGRKLEFVVHD